MVLKWSAKKIKKIRRSREWPVGHTSGYHDPCLCLRNYRILSEAWVCLHLEGVNQTAVLKLWLGAVIRLCLSGYQEKAKMLLVEMGEFSSMLRKS